MRSARRYIPTNTRFFTTLVRWTYGLWLRLAYNLRVTGTIHPSKIRPPFVLVANHVGVLDPFMLNAVLPHPIHWVTSDGNMRTPIIRFLLLKLVGSIPKSKAIPDIETVNWIVDIIRKKRGVVGLFPEGQASWDGRTQDSFPATAKLLKILRAPVILGKIRGGYLSLPRWTSHRRKGLVELDFSVLFSPEDLKAMTPDEIHSRLEAGLAHDEAVWQKKTGHLYPHLKAAENLELALFVCPGCASVSTMRGSGDRFSCTACGFSTRFDGAGCFNPLQAGTSVPSLAKNPSEPSTSPTEAQTSPDPERTALAAMPSTIAQWEVWQHRMFRTIILDRIARWTKDGHATPLLEEAQVSLRQGWRMEAMKDLGVQGMRLYPDRLEFHSGEDHGTPLQFSLAEIESPGILKKNFFEFYVGKSVYRVVFPDCTHTARSWVAAFEVLAETTHTS